MRISVLDVIDTSDYHSTKRNIIFFGLFIFALRNNLVFPDTLEEYSIRSLEIVWGICGVVMLYLLLHYFYILKPEYLKRDAIQDNGKIEELINIAAIPKSLSKNDKVHLKSLYKRNRERTNLTSLWTKLLFGVEVIVTYFIGIKSFLHVKSYVWNLLITLG